ncbi:MAG: VCBS repeat-containing protein [Planctomycetes bacterium]|nr:VCBS repeat-containing protein [Planctomycetota bacterium]
MGGAVGETNQTTVSNSTIVDNEAGNDGGAIFNEGTLRLYNSTVTNNTAAAGGGLAVDSSTTEETVRNSIIAENVDDQGNTDDVEVVELDEDSNNWFGTTHGNPMLGPLQDNGGPTLTRVPLTDSPVIDLGGNVHAIAAGLTTDQRGEPRTVDGDRDGNTVVDLGAAEYKPPTIIRGQKFNDLDGDGVRDPGEPGMDGWTIQLFAVGGGEPLSQDVTQSIDWDENGSIDPETEQGWYEFTDLDDGTYAIDELLQAGWEQTVVPTPIRASGQIVEDAHVGNWIPGPSIAGQKFHDVDGDGIRDPGEPGLDGWTIQLLDRDGVVLDEQVTRGRDLDGDGVIDEVTERGQYFFGNLDPAVNPIARIVEVAQPGWEQTVPGGNGEHRLPVPSGPADGFDFGNVALPGSIHGQKFWDRNGDGKRDFDEPGMNGWTIQLRDWDGNLVAEQITHRMDLDGDGRIEPFTEEGLYWFQNVEPGDYTVDEVQRSGWTQTLPTGSFLSPVIYDDAENDPTSVLSGDLDGDGDSDVVLGHGLDSGYSGDRGNLSVFLNDGEGSLGTPFLVPTTQDDYVSPVLQDLDGDSDLDIAVLNRYADTVSVHWNNGVGSIPTIVEYVVGDSPYSMAWGDVNNDGLPDLITGNQFSQDLTLMLNNGNQQLAAPVSISVDTATTSIAYGFYPTLVTEDLNNDGALDIALTHIYGTDLQILLNDGLGNFGVPQLYPIDVSNASDIDAADVNGDGNIDLIVANPNEENLLALTNTGGGAFTQATTYATSVYGYFVTVADLNGDGAPELVTGDTSYPSNTGDIAVLFNNRNGSFARPTRYASGGSYSKDVAAADLDGDGDLELISANYWDDTVSVLENTVGIHRIAVGNSEVVVGVDFGNFRSGIEGQKFNDINGDGIHDSGEVGLDGWTIQLIDAAGDLVDETVTSSEDLNGDGVIDPETEQGVYSFAGMGNDAYTIREVEQTGWRQSLFAEPVLLPPSVLTEDVETGDFDRDGDRDIALLGRNNASVSLLLQAADGSLVVGPTTLGGGGRPIDFTVASFNAARGVDVALVRNDPASGNAYIDIFDNNGDASFTTSLGALSITNATASSLAAFDVDNDQDLDLVVTANGSADGIFVFRKNGSGTFGILPETFASADEPSSAVPSDVDGDGDLDLLVTHASPTSGAVALSYHENLGLDAGWNGFAAGVVLARGEGGHSVTVADFDNDGDADLSWNSHLAEEVAILANRGNGTFDPPEQIDGGGFPKHLTSSDVDHDGNVDLLAVSRPLDAAGGISLILNQGDGTFDAPDHFAAGNFPAGVIVDDMNGDDKVDLVTWHGESRQLSVMSNLTPIVDWQFGDVVTDVNLANIELRQIVSGATDSLVIPTPTERLVTVPVVYTTSDLDETLSGLGLRMHYDSSVLDFKSLIDDAPNAFQTAQLHNDTADFDNDPLTDKFVLTSWLEDNSNWPSQSLPTTLFDAEFHVVAAGDATTAIRFTGSSTAVTHRFEGVPIEIETISASLDIDDNGVADALSDGLLIVRRLFGADGQALVANAVASDAQRTDPDEIAAYIDYIKETVLDVDDNGASHALTDGVLVQRRLFGYEDDLLTDGALAIDAERTNPAEVANCIDRFIPGPLLDHGPFEPIVSPYFPLDYSTFGSYDVLCDSDGDGTREVCGTNDYDVYSYVPDNAKGLVFFSHGSTGGAGIVNRLESIVLIDNLIDSGYAVVATESTRRNGNLMPGESVTWDHTIDPDYNADFLRVSALREQFLDDYANLDEDTPVFPVGFSNGGGWSSVLGEMGRAIGWSIPTVGVMSSSFSGSGPAIDVRQATFIQVLENDRPPAVGSTRVANLQDYHENLKADGFPTEFFVGREKVLGLDRFNRIEAISLVPDAADAVFRLLVEGDAGPDGVENTADDIAGPLNAEGLRRFETDVTHSLLQDLEPAIGIILNQHGVERPYEAADEAVRQASVVAALHQVSGEFAEELGDFFDAQLPDPVTDQPIGGPEGEGFIGPLPLIAGERHQILTTTARRSGASANSVSFDVAYGTDPAATATTGLGTRLHFDSSQLDFVQLAAAADGLIVEQVQTDIEDLDGDPATDKFLLTGFFDIDGQWPHMDSRQERLGTIEFDVTDDFHGPTTLNITPVSTASGFELTAPSITIGKPHNNPGNVRDVNGDGTISPLDALIVINRLIERGSQLLDTLNLGPFSMDVDNDGHLSPKDALWVINYWLNRGN